MRCGGFCPSKCPTVEVLATAILKASREQGVITVSDETIKTLASEWMAESESVVYEFLGRKLRKLATETGTAK